MSLRRRCRSTRSLPIFNGNPREAVGRFGEWQRERKFNLVKEDATGVSPRSLRIGRTAITPGVVRFHGKPAKEEPHPRAA
jgi:hypothetical protein